MQTGTFETRAEVTEQTPYGPHTYTFTKMIMIEEFQGRFYQTERSYRDSIITFSAQYPADTDYAKQRRDGIVSF